MKVFLWRIISALLIVVTGATLCPAASLTSGVLKARQEAEANGYTFITSHEEIVAKAKNEGKLRVLAGMESSTGKAAAAAFTKKYPFINLQIGEIEGAQQAERNILEIRSGAKNWDIIVSPTIGMLIIFLIF